MAQMEKLGRTTISRRNKHSETSGFTLIEILIVLSIIGMVMAIGLPAIQRVTLTRVNSLTRKFVGLTRTIRNDAILLNTVHRLAIDFDNSQYWVEMQRSFELLNTEEPNPKKKKGKKEEPPPSNFILSDKFGKKPTPLPDGVVIDGVLKEREGLRKEGMVYIHFFPNGFNDQAIIYLNRAGSKSEGYSLVLRPTSGRIEIMSGRVDAF